MFDEINLEEEETPTVGKRHEENLDMEAEYVELPSLGVYYKGRYKGLERLKVRKLNWVDEDILTTKSYYDNGTLFDELLKNTIVDDNGFKPSMLVAVDRDAIIWWLRIGAFGTKYEIPFSCPKCKKKGKIIWDLAEIEVPDFNEEVYEELSQTGGLKIKLPISNLECKITVPTIGIEKQVAKMLEKKKKDLKTTKDFNNTGKLLSCIEEAIGLDGKVYKERTEVLNFWLNTGYNGNPLPLVDSRYIINKLKTISLKIDTKQDIYCDGEDCDHTEEGVSMPMSIYFFWPEFESI